MEHFPVIVVGGGPAGAEAARVLASAGHRALLLERATMPRYKPCGGGLGPKTVARLPFPIETLKTVRVPRVSFRLRGNSPVDWDLPDEFAFHMAMRDDLDSRLVQFAAAAGAEVHDGEPVRDVSLEDGGFLLRTTSGRYWTRYLIGADGATGTVRRFLGLTRRKEQGLALEAEVEVPDAILEEYSNAALFDVDAAPEGYGWVFPKTTHLSVGIGSMRLGQAQLQASLRAFIVRYRLAGQTATDTLTVHAHPLPVASSGERARLGSALLAGDAAGVADGFGGEGISNAMASGELAGRAIAAALGGNPASIERYEQDLDRLIRQDHGFANLMGLIARRFPDAAYHTLTSLGEGKSALIPLLLGEITFGECLRRLPGLAALGERMRGQ